VVKRGEIRLVNLDLGAVSAKTLVGTLGILQEVFTE